MRKGSRLMPPPVLNQLIREVIEWCADADTGGEGLGALGTADFVHLVLSINGDQEAQDPSGLFHVVAAQRGGTRGLQRGNDRR
jgi:hypothetical protein